MELGLTLIKPSGETKRLPKLPDRIVFGRSNDCQVRIPAADISRHHCLIEVSEDAVVAEDMDSRNGTYLNGQRITKAELSAGDVLAVGTTVFFVQLNGEPGEFDADEKYAIAASGATGSSTGSSSGKSSGGADAPTTVSSGIKKAEAKSGGLGGGSLAADLGGSSDDSSVLDFDFDFGDDDEDDQPPL